MATLCIVSYFEQRKKGILHPNFAEIRKIKQKYIQCWKLFAVQ
jgi:hypothetical protein